MNRNILITIGVLILALSGGGLFISAQQSPTTEEAKTAEEKTAIEKKDDSSAGSEQDKMMKKDSASRYIEYSKTVLDQATNKRRVLYFYASWCPICRPANEDFIKNSSKIPGDTMVIRVNYNDPDTDQEEKDLAKKYGITYQHTFVQIDYQGKEITKWSGGQTEELLANIK